MSYGVEAAPKKALPPSVARTGASPGCVVATLIFCAGGGALFVTTVVVAAIGFAVYASSQAEQSARVQAGGADQAQRIAAERLEEMQTRIEQDQDRMRQRMESLRVEPSRFEPIEMPAFPEPMAPAFPSSFPRHDFPRGPRFEPRNAEPIEFEHRFTPSVFEHPAAERPAFGRPAVRPPGFSASPMIPSGEASRLPLIVRPASVTYSRSVSRPSRLRPSSGEETRSPTTDPIEQRLERLQALSHHPEAFAVEATWFADRKPILSEATVVRVETTIEEFILHGDTPEAVQALPQVLPWYDRSNLEGLGRLLLREAELENVDSPMPRRQILVGTFQRYRTLDRDWRYPGAGDVLRALTKSMTISNHIVPSIEALHPPYPASVEDFLIEFSFAAASESMYAQRKALIDRPTRERLLDEAVARLESIDEAQRESAYVILAAAGPTPERADAALDAICHAFANESVEPSPAAHAALARWIDREHAADFREFCECDCPIRRFAARAAVARFPVEADALAVSD